MKLLNHKIVFTVGILLLTVFSFAQQTPGQRKELELKRKELVAKIQDTKKVLEETRSKKTNSLKQLKAISRQIKTRENIIAIVQQQIAEMNRLIQQEQDTIAKLKKDLIDLKEDYAKNILGAYKARNVYDKMMFVFSSKSFNQAIKRIQYLNQYSDYRRQQAELILKKQNELINQMNELLAAKKEKMALINMKEDEKKELEGDKKEESEVLTVLQKREKELRKQLAENEKAAKKLNKAIEDLIAREIAEARRKEEEARKREEAARAAAEAKGTPVPVKKETPKTSSTEMYLTPEALKISNDFEGNKKNLPWPVEKGYITEEFGQHAHPTLKGVMVNNNGVDIATQPGAIVRCVFKGTVVAIIKTVPGMGEIVLVSHGKYFTAYAKLASVNPGIEKGKQLNIKDAIGTVMTDTEEDVTEVHFEVWKMEQKIDPELWLKN
ncbi:MAG: peptidoglycan DD-metalloendopeptidase family protein [Bacteroidota bacterium]